MKVGIDGVLLGAWADVYGATSILDIGAGSGLISLMLAQRSDANIDAIDIDEGAVQQSGINFSNSPWSLRLNIVQITLQEFAQSAAKKYDFIVSNPPYFVNSLKTPDTQRTTARHAETLSHEELIICSEKLLSKTGRIALILPVDEGYKCIEFAKTIGLYCSKLVKVFPKPNAQVKRLLIELSFDVKKTTVSEITIESEVRHSYSADFTALARDFYLNL